MMHICFLFFTWQTFKSLVEQIRYDHDAHEKLAELLVDIRLRDSLEEEDDDVRSFDYEEQL